MNAASAWTFRLPTAVTFGNGCVRELARMAAAWGQRPLVAADRGLVQLPLFEHVREALPAVPVFSDLEPDPTVASVDALASMLRSDRHDVVVAVGGGGALDCARQRPRWPRETCRASVSFTPKASLSAPGGSR